MEQDYLKANLLEELQENHFLFTSESVCRGHPDKMCDFISDCVLDAALQKDKESKVACECAVKNNFCIVFGEITCKGQLFYEQIVREAIKDIGYDNLEQGMDYKNSSILTAIDQQSQEIFDAVIKSDLVEEVGAGDQGLMMGYATDETPELMPLTHVYASNICARLHECKVKGIIPWLGPDGKSQVTIEYKNENGKVTPVRVHTILISAQHKPETTMDQIQKACMEHVIKPLVDPKLLDSKTKYYLNPSGSFSIGGPTGDAGLTGRKIIVDSYGGWGGHGGGAFSGKDPSKVDRSGAYAARWVAKSLVNNKFCNRCLIQISYGIGVATPISVHVDSYGTVAKGYKDSDLVNIVLRNFDLRPGCIVRDLKLKRPIYKKTAAHGHFGKSDPDFTWEQPKDLSHEMKK